MNNVVSNCPEAFCQICNNEKQLDEVNWVSKDNSSELEKVLTGKKKDCPGCDGTGISTRAKQWRKDNNWK